MAYNTQCCHDNEFNNLKIVEQLVNLRMELAQLLGFTNYAEYVLKNAWPKIARMCTSC